VLDLPYVDDGPFAREWGVRARTFERFVAEVIEPRERVEAASPPGRIVWRRRRVPYPLWYELRPLKAWLTRSRRPSRFDLWVGEVG